jgi:hypothetical protein
MLDKFEIYVLNILYSIDVNFKTGKLTKAASWWSHQHFFYYYNYFNKRGVKLRKSLSLERYCHMRYRTALQSEDALAGLFSLWRRIFPEKIVSAKFLFHRDAHLPTRKLFPWFRHIKCVSGFDSYTVPKY